MILLFVKMYLSLFLFLLHFTRKKLKKKNDIIGLEHPISPLSKIFHCVCDRNHSNMMSTSNTSKLKKYQFIRAFQSDKFTPDLPMFVNTKTITFITLSCTDYIKQYRILTHFYLETCKRVIGKQCKPRSGAI